MQTLLLDQTTWDLVLDSNGNIAMASEPYALAQDVASYVKTYLGEVYYDTTLGIPYFQEILGKSPSIAALKNYLIDAALQVPDVVQAQAIIQNINKRSVVGQLQFVDITGQANGIIL